MPNPTSTPPSPLSSVLLRMTARPEPATLAQMATFVLPAGALRRRRR